ncbi:hypothetical protein FSP39_018819 [Pinctada imbricata]|uniref:G-protein coupled receptors family 1 profile domain-containing protein n=1 Tax=Pinctada imbricata TaxID=66713 RepID=A0AA89BV23_PINIB|nr:hypothetical protein FSP39_018819 [Pinctada imbricata]
MATILLPVVVYVSILMVLGIIGNAIVCYIYLYKWKVKSVKYFIGCLSSLDLLTCLFCMPIEIAMLRNPLLLDDPVLCKFLRFVRAFTSLSAGFMLIVIAIDRFRRICKHHETQISVSLAKKMCLSTLIAGIIFSWPCFIIFGQLDRSDELTIETSCSTDRHLKGTIYPTIFYGVIFLCFMFISVSLVTFYTMIGVRLCKLPSLKKSSSKRYSVTESTNSSQNDGLENQRQFLEREKVGGSKIKTDGSLLKNKQSFQKRLSKIDLKGKLGRHMLSMNRRKQTTIVLFLITLIQWLSFFPYVALLVCNSVIPNFLSSMDSQQQMAYNIGILSHFISSGINPFIYGFLGRDFREECRRSFSDIRNSLNSVKRLSVSSITRRDS